MTIADFLYQAGFWQWVGVILFACALANVRLVTISKTVKRAAKDKTP